jgi:hypothetical protein
MRLVKATDDGERTFSPPEAREALEGIGRFNEELVKADLRGESDAGKS